MRTNENPAYCARVEANTKGMEALSTGVCPGCSECMDDHGGYTVSEDYGDDDTLTYSFKARAHEHYATEDEAKLAAIEAHKEDWSTCKVYSEASFSWNGCDICGSSLGAELEVYHYISDGEIRHDMGACPDCVAYLANGDIPEPRTSDSDD